ncbi:hypothetical protein AIIKEEIJ_02834 [Rhodococcus sp. YH1]|nr:hypothetical protein [Rhodococcus sp. YH1]
MHGRGARPLRDECETRVGVRAVEHQPPDRAGQAVVVRGHGDAQDGPGIGEHVLDPFLRVPRVDGHERRSGPCDRPDREHRFERSGQCQGDEGAGTGAARGERVGEQRRAGVELAIGDLPVVGDHGDGVGSRGRGGVQQLGQGHRGDGLRARAGAQVVGLLRVEQVDVADRGVRVLGDRRQQPAEAGGEGPRGAVVEQVGGVTERHLETGGFAVGGRAFAQCQAQVEG